VTEAAQAGAAAPSAAVDFDPARLDAFLRERYPRLAGKLAIDRTVGGMSNPTYFISYDDWSVVLRKQPRTILTRSAHNIEREFRVMSALYGSDVPVPKPLLYHTDAAVVGTPFYLMERLHGRVFPAYQLPGLSPQDRHACYMSMCAVMAAMHNFDWQAAGLADFGRPGNYFERQLSRWSQQWEQFRSADNPYVDQLIAWLRDRVPDGDGTTVCHGDFRVPNLMFHATQPRVIGVLDWELSTLGHALADVAFNLQAWRMLPEENGGLRGLDWPALGIPGEAEYLEAYYRLRGPCERLSTFHMAFAMFRAAVGSASIAARGTAIGGKLSLAYARRGVEAITEPGAARV
jgi:aminoglycoside phosphotransferase (APT) family kinase protein